MTGCSGNAILPIIVIPEYMTWTPQKGSFDWNDDDNWSRSIASDADLTNYVDDPNADGYVPLDFTKVTIREASTYPWLRKPEWKSDGSYEIDTNSGIDYDINFEIHLCQHIFFRSATELIGQDLLRYQKACLDFTLAKDRWYMLSSLLLAVFACDMHLPTA